MDAYEVHVKWAVAWVDHGVNVLAVCDGNVTNIAYLVGIRLLGSRLFRLCTRVGTLLGL
jgi:hypothetical protein